MLGTGTQTARKAVDDGLIGTPVAATAFMTTAGHERWHPDPEFYYRPGGGPLLDMGPYYLSALVHLLGPVVRVTGAASRPRAERIIGSGPRAGQRFAGRGRHPCHRRPGARGRRAVHPGDELRHPCRAAAAHRGARHRRARSSVPDPNGFDGPVELTGRRRAGTPLPVSAGYAAPGAARASPTSPTALEAGRPHRASAELAAHVLDIMLTLLDAAREGRPLPVASSCERPAPVPLTG